MVKKKKKKFGPAWKNFSVPFSIKITRNNSIVQGEPVFQFRTFTTHESEFARQISLVKSHQQTWLKYAQEAYPLPLHRNH